MAWIKVEEHVPPAGKIVRAYSRVYGLYFFAKWSAARGWLDQKDCSIRVITEWDDAEYDFPFPILEDIDEELAKQYGFDTSSSSFYKS